MAISHHTRSVLDQQAERRKKESCPEHGGNSPEKTLEELKFPTPEKDPNIASLRDLVTAERQSRVPPLIPCDLPPELRAHFFASQQHATAPPKEKHVLLSKASGQSIEANPRVQALLSSAESLHQSEIRNHGYIYAKDTRSCEAAPVAEWNKLFERYGQKFDLDPNLLAAVAETESQFNPRAVSKRGACGLMQLSPETAQDMGVRNAFNAEENIRGGARYLRALFDRFGNIEHALAAYNAGPAIVEQHHGIPPFPETREYVAKVLNRYHQLRS